ncbi:MAG: hypothetical protein NTY38_17710 [Acidobacteria bacterium]|nr:hypothetical protein [Acidobacteriota bacterium]
MDGGDGLVLGNVVAAILLQPGQIGLGLLLAGQSFGNDMSPDGTTDVLSGSAKTAEQLHSRK